jgi:hypothetical protein
MRRIAVKLLGLLAMAPSPGSAQTWPAPPVGVYGCFGQYGPALPMMFGLLDQRTYSSYDGKKGRYTYDMANGLLTMNDGPLAGIRYQRVGDPSLTPAFRMLNENGQVTSYMCPKEGTKDPNKHPW